MTGQVQTSSVRVAERTSIENGAPGRRAGTRPRALRWFLLCLASGCSLAGLRPHELGDPSGYIDAIWLPSHMPGSSWRPGFPIQDSDGLLGSRQELGQWLEMSRRDGSNCLVMPCDRNMRQEGWLTDSLAGEPAAAEESYAAAIRKAADRNGQILIGWVPALAGARLGVGQGRELESLKDPGSGSRVEDLQDSHAMGAGFAFRNARDCGMFDGLILEIRNGMGVPCRDGVNEDPDASEKEIPRGRHIGATTGSDVHEEGVLEHHIERVRSVKPNFTIGVHLRGNAGDVTSVEDGGRTKCRSVIAAEIARWIDAQLVDFLVFDSMADRTSWIDSIDRSRPSVAGSSASRVPVLLFDESDAALAADLTACSPEVQADRWSGRIRAPRRWRDRMLRPSANDVAPCDVRRPTRLTSRSLVPPVAPTIFPAPDDTGCHVLALGGRQTLLLELRAHVRDRWEQVEVVPGSPALLRWNGPTASLNALAVRCIDTVGQRSEWALWYP